MAELADPFGNVLGLIENPHFDRARSRGSHTHPMRKRNNEGGVKPDQDARPDRARVADRRPAEPRRADDAIASAIKPGVTTIQLDQLC